MSNLINREELILHKITELKILRKSLKDNIKLLKKALTNIKTRAKYTEDCQNENKIFKHEHTTKIKYLKQEQKKLKNQLILQNQLMTEIKENIEDLIENYTIGGARLLNNEE